MTSLAATRPIRSAIVLMVDERRCHVLDDASPVTAEYAPQFPTPHVERVSPGHRVALATAPDGRSVVLWRWYDAVVVGLDGDRVRLWEPAHGEISAARREREQTYALGTRAYLSAGLPGADWWVAGPVTEDGPGPADLDEVAQLYTRHELWAAALAPVSSES